MTDLTLKQFLERASEVTSRYMASGGKWDLEKQDKKIDEELFEFRTATSSLNELEEAWDIIFSVLTALHLKDYTNYAILESALSTLAKIEQRSKNALEGNPK